MSINVMSTGYDSTAYVNNKTAKSEAGKSFAEIANQKAAETDKETVQERAAVAFDTIGAYAPDEVKQAWMEAVEETGTNVSFSHDEEGFHIPLPQLMVQRVVRWLNGEVDPGSLLNANNAGSINRMFQYWSAIL